MPKPKRKIEKLDFYGEGWFSTEFHYKKWVLDWHFPFLHRKTYWSGTLLEAQREINKLRSRLLDRLNAKT